MPVIGAVHLDEREEDAVFGYWLRRAFSEIDVPMQINSRKKFDSVGLDLTDTMKSLLEVLMAWSLLPRGPYIAIRMYYGPEKCTQDCIAQFLGVTDRTVRNYLSDGRRAMKERIFDN